MGGIDEYSEQNPTSSLKNFTDEQLVYLKRQAIENEDYDKAKEIKQEQERRKGHSLENGKKTSQDLIMSLYEGDEHTESTKKYFIKIYKNFEEFAKYKNKILRQKIENRERDIISIDSIYYYTGEGLREFLKSFCSDFANTMGPLYVIQPEKNNNELLRELGLQEPFNKIYRRMLMFSHWYSSGILTGKEYYLLADNMFRNLKETIERSNSENFYDKSLDDRDIPAFAGQK